MVVSIITPLYKVEDFIARCADSLFRQSYTEIEYIFVDDCSSDRSSFLGIFNLRILFLMILLNVFSHLGLMPVSGISIIIWSLT